MARLVYALALAPDPVGLDDDSFFHQTALEIADGHGYVGTLDVFTLGSKQPTADHPPLYPLLLGLVGRLGGRGVDAQRMVGVCAGTVTVWAVGMTARRLAGDRAMLAAALLCAAYPAFIAADGALMSETLFGALTALAVLQALVLLGRPSRFGMALLGLLVALAALTRSEGLLLLPLLAVPVLIAAPADRLALLGCAAAVAILAISPWVIRNWSAYGEPVYATDDGATLAGANCDSTYYGAAIGGFDFSCVEAVDVGQTTNRAVRARRQRNAGVDYACDHAGRALLVGAARFGRLWGLYGPGDQAHVTGRPVTLQRLGVGVYYLALVAGLAGVVALLRRGMRLPLAVLLTPLVLAGLTAVLTYGLIRIRHIAEVSLIVLAGVAIAAALERRGRRGAAPA
jgi:4-amino-4-deoxy-L-arabinose transferase-like glycosyltransferase